MADPNLGQVAASVWDAKVSEKPEDNIFTSQWLLNRLSQGGMKASTEGGKTIEETLEFAENTTFGSMAELDTLDTTRIDVFDAATFAWKQIGGTVVYSEFEKLRAAARNRKFDVIAAKLENGRNSLSAELNRELHSDGSGNSSQDIGGVDLIIATAPTTGTVGAINRALHAFWRNRQTSGAQTSTDFDNLRSTMRSIYNQCSNGAFSQHPTFAWTDRTVFEGYESLLTALERYTTADKSKKGDAGFTNSVLAFKGAKLAYDEDATASELRFANQKNLKLRYLKGGWMKMFPAVDPANQFVNVHKVGTWANMTTNNSRRLGVVTAIT